MAASPSERIAPSRRRSLSVGILTPSGADAALAVRILARARIDAVAFADMQELRAEMQKGLGAVVVAEEALGEEHREVLNSALANQPEWSDLPVVLLLSKGELSRAISPGVADV